MKYFTETGGDSMEFSTERISYLQMIQGIIDRLSNKSGNIKGFATTTVAGVTALSFEETNPYILLLAFMPIIVFILLDTYYLGLERKYRFLYEQVRQGKEVDFDMTLDLKESEIIKAKATKFQCLMSKSIKQFYIPLLLVVTGVLILKFTSII